MKKILNTLDSCILAGKTLLHLRAGDRLNRIGDAEKRWITTESGSHIQLDENGTIIAGAGGKFNGKNIKEMGGTKKFTKYQTNAERQSLDIKRKRYSVSERFGENHYRVSGKLLPQSTTNFNDDFSISDRNGEHFIKNSNDNWLRDSSGSAISFDTEKKAKDFLSKIKEVAKDQPDPAKPDSNKKLSELRKNLASAQTEQDYKKAQLELMQHTIYNHSETSDYNKINSENNDLMALVKARFPIESKKLTKTKQSPYGELSLIEDVYGQKHWVKSDFKDSKQSRLKTFTEKGEPRKDGGIVLKDNIHSDYLTAKPASNKQLSGTDLKALAERIKEHDKINSISSSDIPSRKREKINYSFNIDGGNKQFDTADTHIPYKDFKIITPFQGGKNRMTKVFVLDKNNNFVAYKVGKGNEKAIINAIKMIESGNVSQIANRDLSNDLNDIENTQSSKTNNKKIPIKQVRDDIETAEYAANQLSRLNKKDAANNISFGKRNLRKLNSLFSNDKIPKAEKERIQNAIKRINDGIKFHNDYGYTGGNQHDFTPTHTSSTGEPLQHIEGNIYRDVDGFDIEDNHAKSNQAEK